LCNPTLAQPVVVMRSSYDGSWWIVEGKSVRKLREDDLVGALSDCEVRGSATYCPKEALLLVWSRNGSCAVGLKGVIPEDPDAWCNLARLAELLREKLPEPVIVEDVYAAAAQLIWSSEGVTAST